MPTLLSKHPDEGSWSPSDAPIPEWQTAEDWSAGAPLLLEGEQEPDASYVAASAIAIRFPAFNDGRGLSLAMLLRTRLGYTGPLYAVGAVHEDILHYMVRCGFDHIVLPDERDSETALKLIMPYSAHYQACALEDRPAFRRENRGADA